MRRTCSDNHLCYAVNRVRCESAKPKLKNSKSVGIFSLQISSSMIPNSLKSFLYDPETSKDMSMDDKDVSSDEDKVESNADRVESNEEEIANWFVKLLEIRNLWKNRGVEDQNLGSEEVGHCDCCGGSDEAGCSVNYESEEGTEEIYDRKSFSKFLVQVPLSDIRSFSQLAFLCNMAYVIPDIKGKDLKRYSGLQFVTSSVEKKAEAAAIKAKFDQDYTCVPVTDRSKTRERCFDSEQKRPIRSSVAYGIAASAASYAQSQNDSQILDSCKSGELEAENSPRVYKSEVAARMAASTMTAVVAAGEKEKQEAVRDFQSANSSPCEWFVCDDASTYTRCFVIQGSDSMASWLANLLFEPTNFEDTEALVHRGIYEAAKGIYSQFLPEIMDHLEKHGNRAKFQFTGHSLGGSLSLLVDLMLVARKVLKPSQLRPVITFGSPFVFCGGQKILKDLGLDENHIHCVMMHRDIVPRAFSCNYPDYISSLLKRLSSFGKHTCLLTHKHLYSPLGKPFILQPDKKASPSHPLLPPGNALYFLDRNHQENCSNAFKAFLNLPHPLDTLSDPTAYGSDGTILRDHDSSNYLKAINGVLRQHKKTALPPRKKLEERTSTPWPLLVSPSPHWWSHESNLESNGRLVKSELMSGV